MGNKWVEYEYNMGKVCVGYSWNMGEILLEHRLYRGSSSNAVFRAPKKTALEENRVRRGRFKYYLLIKRAP